MTILEALKTKNIHAVKGARWLTIDWVLANDPLIYVVCEKRSYARQTTIVYRGDDEQEAVRVLLNEG